MSTWTKQRLDQMVIDGVEESLTLDYKRAGSLAKTHDKRMEITKDVSSFANSSGGVVIYGVAEPSDQASRHLPERLDPVLRTEFSKEWLEQVIQTVQPRIEGLVIHPVIIDKGHNTVCYVVEIHQSHTAHMAGDHRYYKRQNFNALAMEDYEVRDVMNRKTHPRIRASIFINRAPAHSGSEELILVRLENVGPVLARHVMVELEVPLNMNGLVSIEDPVLLDQRDDGACYVLRLTPKMTWPPIFPGSDVTLRRRITGTFREIRDKSGNAMVSSTHVKVTVFADEMPALRAKLDIAPVLLGWTTLPNADSP